MKYYNYENYKTLSLKFRQIILEYLEYSKLFLYLHCYVYNVSADMFFSLLQVFHKAKLLFGHG